MSLLGSRLARVKPSSTVILAQKARDRQAAGLPTIDLAEGEPDFDTPPHVIEATVAALGRGETRYTAVGGTPALKAAVRDKFERENGLSYAADQVMVSVGAKQVIFNAMTCGVDPGDEVIIPTPCWVSYPDVVTLCEGTPVLVPGRPDGGFKLHPDDLAAAITPATRWLILNSPCNPTGAVYHAEELAALTRVLVDHPRVGILADDIYEHLTYDGAVFATPAQVEPRLFERTLTVNGVSKAYAMTGWRIGYVGGPADLIAAMTTLQGQSTTNPSSVSQAAAVAALTGPQTLLADRRRILAARRDLTMDLAAGTDGLACGPPQGAFYVYLYCADLIGRHTPDGATLANDGDVAAYFMEAAGVALVPGAAFGLSPYVRLCFASPKKVLEAAFAQLRAAITALR